jgi:hypothetical protein
MKRIIAPLVLLWIGYLGGCAPVRQADERNATPDSTGVFVDACKLMVDSITVEKDSLHIHEESGTADYGFPDRAGDTTYFSGVFCFIREVGPAGKPRYFFGYNHRGDRHTWKEGMYMEMIPSRMVVAGKSFKRGSADSQLLCAQVE